MNKQCSILGVFVLTLVLFQSVVADQTVVFSPSETTETNLKRYVFSDQVMFLERLIGDRDSFFIQAHDHEGKLLLEYHFGYGTSRMVLKILYKERFGSKKAKAAFNQLLRLLRNPNRISITDKDITEG